MTTQNKDILNQVKGVIAPKKNNFEKIKKNSSKFPKNDVIQDEINKWIEKNAETISKQIINDHLKKIFK